MKKIIIMGGFGNGTVALSTIEDINMKIPTWDVLGFLNDFEKNPINGYPVLGTIDQQTVKPFLDDENTFFFYSLISVKMNYRYLDKLLSLNIPKERFATLIHPTAVISKFSTIGYGTCIQPFVSVGPNVSIGNHVQIYAQVLVGHGATLEDYSYVANNACIGADVHLKEGAYLGTNSTTLERITMGKWSLAGIGSVVLKDVPDYTKVVGNPARSIGSV